MEYRAVGSRCAFDFECLPEEARRWALEILEAKGFVPVEVDILDLARKCVGVSCYAKRPQPTQAPGTVNCSSLIKWLYGQCGIWLPRRAIQQRDMGMWVSQEEMKAGDLIFATGRIDFYREDPHDGVGHVGLVTERGTVIHAKGIRSGVVEESPRRLLSPSRFRGVRRLVDQTHHVMTFEIPGTTFVETSDDIMWLIIENLNRHKSWCYA